MSVWKTSDIWQLSLKEVLLQKILTTHKWMKNKISAFGDREYFLQKKCWNWVQHIDLIGEKCESLG